MSNLAKFIDARSKLISDRHLNPDLYSLALKESGLPLDELKITKLLCIPHKRDIVKEALSSLVGDEITTFGALARLVGSRGAQGVTSIVTSALIDPVSASRVFSAPRDETFSAGDTLNTFASHDPDYQDVPRPRSQALRHTDIQFQQAAKSVFLVDPRYVDEQTLANRLTYLL